MLNEFKDFIMKGNVMDLAVGVIIAGAFALITASLVGDIIMPIVGWIFGGLDFSNYFIPLGEGVTATSLEEAKEQGAVLAYGAFITTVLNFIIIGFIIFMMVKFVKNLEEKVVTKEEEEEAPAEPSEDILLLREIRDGLKK